MRKLKIGLFIAVFNIVTASLLLESAIALMFQHPKALTYLPANFVRSFRVIYNTEMMSVIQHVEEYRVEDSELLYTLRPGRFVYSNLEFKTPFLVNSLGVRDDEASLKAPSIVVLGDSYAMGWGVQQSEAFPQLIEGMAGTQVLNAGISSYGTVRELKLLNRIDTSKLKHLIIQYCPNDFPENEAFWKMKEGYLESAKEIFRVYGDKYRERTQYWPMKYSWSFFKNLTIFSANKKNRDRPKKKQFDRRPAKYFIHALRNVPKASLEGVQITVLEVPTGRGFVDQLRQEIADPKLPRHIREVQLVELEDTLGTEDNFILDYHLRPSGHQKIAQKIVPLLSRRWKP
jgi:hypothetical protein